MERMLSFDIARKLMKPDTKTKGLVSKSITGHAKRAVMQVSTGGREGNDRVRAACDDYRLRTAKDISCIVRGKSVEVTVADDANAVLTMMDFGTTLPLVQEDLLECFAFVWQHRMSSYDGSPFDLYGVDCDEGAFRISVGIVCQEHVTDEQVFTQVMTALEPCNMGIVKSGL